jgi:hypothetical protein
MRGTYLVPPGANCHSKLPNLYCQIFTFDKEIGVCLNAATEAWIEPQVSFCQAQAGHAVDGFEVSGDLGSKVVSKRLMRGQAPFFGAVTF